MTDQSFIYGKNAIIEALETNSREFNRILISNTSRADEKIEKIKDLAKNNGVVFQFVGKEKLNQIAQEARHQGVIAQVSPIKYVDLDDFIEKHSEDLTSLIILDGVEDSHNLGAIIRSAVCAGVVVICIRITGSVLCKRTLAYDHIVVVAVTANVRAYVEILKVDILLVLILENEIEDDVCVSVGRIVVYVKYYVEYTS